MVIDQSSVLLDHVADFRLSKAIREDFCLCFNLDHKLWILVDYFPYFPLQVCPYFLFVLHYVLCFVQFRFQFFNVGLKVFDSLNLLLFKVY